MLFLSLSEEERKKPFQISYEQEYHNAEDWDFVLTSYVVPTGNRLVIEFASVLVINRLGEGVTITIETSVDEIISTHYLTLSNIFDGSQSKVYSGSQQIRVYADPDTTVSIKAKRYSDTTNGAPADNFTFLGSISGYLENVSSNAF